MTGAGGLRAIALLLTTDCNLTCRYCLRDSRRPATMATETLRRALDVALDLAGPTLTIELSGGEPLLAPDLVREALAHLRRRSGGGPRVECRLLTNGLGLDDTMLDLLIAGEVDLQVSCDGPVGQDERGVGTLPRLERLFDTIRRRDPRYWRRRVSVATVFSPATVPTLSGAVAWLLGQDIASLTLAPVCGQATAWGAASCRHLARQLRTITDLCLAWRDRTGLLPLTNLLERPSPTSSVACGAALGQSLVVVPDGSVHRCALLALAARSHLGPAASRLARALHHGSLHDLRRRPGPASGPPLAILAGHTTWTGGGRPCIGCPQEAACRACPVSGPVPGVIPDAHCLFQRWMMRAQRRLADCDPLVRLLPCLRDHPWVMPRRV